MALAGVNAVLCEEADTDNTTTTTTIETDPYEEAARRPPNEDEPTNCSICMTFRQGPCRVPFRKFELCQAETEKTAESKGEKDIKDGPCDKYLAEVDTCHRDYLPLYGLISLQVWKDGLSEVMADYENETIPMSPTMTTMEWSAAKGYCLENGVTLSDMVKSPLARAAVKGFVPLIEARKAWESSTDSLDTAIAAIQQLDRIVTATRNDQEVSPDFHPVVVPVYAHLPTVDGESRRLVTVYAKADEGNLLGWEDVKRPTKQDNETEENKEEQPEKEMEEQPEKETEEQQEKETEEEKEDNAYSSLFMVIQLFKTRQVVVYAVYEKDGPTNNGSDESATDDTPSTNQPSRAVYQSKPYSVLETAIRAGLPLD